MKSIRATLLIIILALSLLPLMIISVVSLTDATKTLKKDAAQRYKAELADVSRGIDETLTARIEKVKSLRDGSTLAGFAFLGMKKYEFDQEVYEMQKANGLKMSATPPEIGGTVNFGIMLDYTGNDRIVDFGLFPSEEYVDLSGIVRQHVYAGGSDDDDFASLNPSGINRADQEWFKRALKGELCISSPQIMPLRMKKYNPTALEIERVTVPQKLITISMPYKPRGELKGVLMVTTSPDFLDYEISKIQYEESSIYILDENKNIIASCKCAAQHDSKHIDIIRNLGDGDNGSRYYQGCLVLYNHTGLGRWKIAAIIPEERILGLVYELEGKTVATILLTLFSVVAVIPFFTGMISRPISNLTKGVEIIGEGNLDYKVNIESKNEIGRLADAFNKMTADLKQTTTSIDNLNLEIAQRKKAEQEKLELVDRIKRQEAAIVKISTNQIQATGEIEQAAQAITEVAAKTLGVDRASIWLLNEDRTKLNCMDLFEKGNGKHSDGASLFVNDHPRYFAAFRQERAVDASDARTDARTSEFADGYLVPLGIVSMLDAAIRIAGKVVGVVCHETIGEKRNWTADEVAFVGEIAEQTAQTLINAERKKAEEELRKTEEKYRVQFEGALDAIFVADAETGVLIDCNPAATKLVGRQKSELIGKHQRILHPTKEIEGDFSRTFKQHLEEKEGHTLETRVITKNGEIKDVAIKASLLEISGKKVLQGIFRDITERKQAEEEIKKSREMLQSMIDAMPFGVMVVGMDKKIRQVNAAAQKMASYSENELVGQLCHKTLCPADENNCPILDQKQVVDNSERKLATKDGRKIPIIKSVVPLKLGDEDTLLEAFIDIAEQKETERKLGEVNKDLEDAVSKLEAANNELRSFVNIASHDLREPMRKITAFGSILEESLKGKLNPNDAENLGFIIEGAQRMTRMIEGLLAYSRVDSGSKSFEIVDLDKAVKRLQEIELAALLKEKQATIEIPRPLPFVEVDPVQIRQLMQYLIANGIKYQKKGNIPHITITSKPAADGMVKIEITDNGIGISPEYHQSIFTMFRRLHSKDEYEGTGIGLAVCKRIVECHGGKIGVESQPDKGSTFWFTVPAAKITVTLEAKNESVAQTL